ncbi:MAG: pyruvate formate lyase-activating protein [Clostridia bacterium]|nr:pyruvate formate lyase-activating protein [Clostridia bacterium]
MKGYIHSFESFGAVDGPGVRYVVFMQGCPLRCLYCHNPDSWKLKEGKRWSVGQVVRRIKPYLNYISTGGVTISGGEPLMQPKFVYKLIKRLHKLKVHVAIDTAGSLPLEKTKKVLDVADLILLDIKAMDNNLCKEVTGQTNENTMATLKYLNHINKPVWIRHVIVPGYTLNTGHLMKLGKELTRYRCVKQVDLLPFHKMGEYKWQELEYDYKLYKTESPEPVEVLKARKLLKKFDLPVIM